MSYEIRTPMSGLAGLLELVGRTELAPAQRRMLDRANASAKSLRMLLDDILDYTRIDAGRMDVAKADLPLRDVVCDAILLMAGAATQKGIELACHIDPALAGMLQGDATRVGQIAVNLLTNAIKFTEQGSITIRLTALESGEPWQTWELAITGTGIGMSAAEQERLFQPFAQAQPSTASQFGGSGLGLVISQRLAELMGGQLVLESALNQGTTARLRLRSAVVEADAREPALVGRRMLLLCRYQAVQATLQDYLRTLGATVVDSAEAAELVLADEPPEMAADLPLVRLISASPLGPLSAQGLAIGIRPPLFTLLRDVCKDALVAHQRVSPDQPEIAIGIEAPLVLVAEDDPTNQMLISGQLSELGCRSLMVADGLAALNAWERHYYDVLITDLHMPRLDGLGLASEIRRRELAGDRDRLPIVALTASAFAEDVERCLASGMDDHVAKPTSLRELYRCLRRWVAVPLKDPGGNADHRGIDDSATLARTVRAFTQDAPHVQSELREALQDSDALRLAQVLHKASGALAVLGYTALSQSIRQTLNTLERDGIEPHRDELTLLLSQVDEGIAEIALIARDERRQQRSDPGQS